jgi:hypothetical protein
MLHIRALLSTGQNWRSDEGITFNLFLLLVSFTSWQRTLEAHSIGGRIGPKSWTGRSGEKCILPTSDVKSALNALASS